MRFLMAYLPDYEVVGGLSFNQKPSTILHIDLNSCFATIEQQANPFLRGRPIAVAAYTTLSGCIIAPSVEAKKLGIKVGLRVKDGKKICPDLIVLPPDTEKYRYVHLQLRRLLQQYTADAVAKSIDEFVLNFDSVPAYQSHLLQTGLEIKKRIKQEIGEWLTVSIGIGPNLFLAKQASNLKKPDGLEEINHKNFQQIYSKLTLLDLCGINTGLTARLYTAGIYTVPQFYSSPLSTLRSAFHSIAGYYWYLRLRGWEIDNINFDRQSFGNMYSLPKHYSDSSAIAPVLHKLVEKTSFRLRRSGYQTRGIFLGIIYTDHSCWHRHYTLSQYVFSTSDIYRLVFRLLLSSGCSKPASNIAVTCFELIKNHSVQLDLFNDVAKKIKLSGAVDSINEKYGAFVVSSAAMLGTSSLVVDRIGFGNIGDLTDS